MKLLEPGRIGTVEIKNRIVMAPMGIRRGGLAEADGVWGERVLEYYRARARGGVGLITTGVIHVTQRLEPFTREYFDIYSDRHLKSLKRVIEAIHQYGAKVSVQLSPGFGRVVFARGQSPDVVPVAVSAMPLYHDPEKSARALTAGEIQELTRAFGLAARRCQIAGADAIELHGQSGYLMDQFMTGAWNGRTDRYGGSREKRLTFAREAITATREEAEGLPIIYRIAANHYFEGGRSPKESLWIVKQLEEMGVNAFHVTAGCFEAGWWVNPPAYQPPGCALDLAEMVKRSVDVPVIAVGKLNHPALAEKALQEGKADFVAIGRGLLADPDWAKKVREGRLDEIRPCICDNEGCLGELLQGRAASCTVNPACGHEKEWALKPVRKRRSLLIVGGGPAGMEAAREASMRGLDVTLWEKSDRLGGNLWPASAAEFKRDLRNLIDYQANQLQKLPVKVELSREAAAGDIINFAADYTILATGAIPALPEIPGMDGHNTATAVDLLLNRGNTGEKVTVVGGGLIGCETAVYLAQQGHKVAIVEILPDILIGVFLHNRNMLLRMMAEKAIAVFTSTSVTAVTPEGARLKKNGRASTLHCDSIILATGMRPSNELAMALAGKVRNLYSIGDCVAPRHIINAIWEAFHAIKALPGR